MNRIDRLSAILIQLQSKNVVTAKEIADRFEISLRTVYRDIRALEEAGIPIGAEAGVGYFINPGFHLPPIMFTNEEASAFLLAEKLVGQLSDSNIAASFESALFKVKAVLKQNDKDHLNNLSDKITVFNHGSVQSKQNLFLHEIQIALANKQLLQIEYTANYNGKQSKRTIEPVSLCNYDMRWHLIAYCRLRNDYRDFRLDRISSLNVLPEYYDEKNHLSLNEYFEQMTKETDLFTIEIKIHESILEKLASSKYWFGLVEETKEGNHYKMRFANSDLESFSKWTLSMEDKVEILSPPELGNMVINNVKLLAKHYLK